MRALMITAALMSATALLPERAHAEDPAFSFGHEPELFLMGGVSAGGSFGSLDAGGFVGAEMSAAWLFGLWWVGFYADGAYDFAHVAGTFTMGPELGWGVLGVDGGLGVRVGVEGEDAPELGAQVRLLVGGGPMALFGRYGYWPASTTGEHIGQVGLLMKFPMWNSTALDDIAP